MTRLVKWGGIVLGGLLLLAVLAAAVLPSLVNLERYRTLLAQRVGKTLGREVTLGALRISLWRGIGAEIEGIQVGQAPGFGAEPLLSAEALRVSVQLLPLLQGQVKVTSAVLERPRVRLVHAQDGHWSVDDLFKSPAPQGPARPPVEGARPGKAPLLGGLVLSQLAVRNGEVTLVEQSQSAPVSVTLADLDLTLRQSSPSDPIELRSRARLAGAVIGQIEAKAQIVLGDRNGPSLDGIATLAGVEFKAWQAVLGGGHDGPPFNGPFSGEVRLAGPLARTAFSGSLNLKPTGIRIGGAFQKSAGEDGQVTFQGQREDRGLRFTKISVAFRDMTLEGTAHLPDVRVPQITFTAASPQLRLDRLLAPGPAPQTRTSSGLAWAAAPGPDVSATGGAAGLSAQGRVNVGELTYKGLTWSGVEVAVRYRDGVLQLPDIRASFVQGTLRAKGEVDLRPKIPHVSLTSRLEKAATEPLVKALALGSWKLTSGLDFDGQTEFVGLVWPDALGSASGSGAILLRQGRLTDYRPLDRLAEAIGPFLAAQGVHVRLNEFDQLGGHYTLDKGVLRTKDLTLTKPEGTITAVGALGLLDLSLDFDVVAKFGRATMEAKVTGTTAQPVVVPKVARLQRRFETELDKILPEGQSRPLKELFKGLFGR